MNNIKTFDPSEVIDQNAIDDENKLVVKSSTINEHQNFMVEKLMQTWQQQQSTDRALRSQYAKYFLVILILELLAMMGIMIAVGRGGLVYDPVLLDLFLTCTIIQIFLSIRTAIKYLFSRDSNVGLEDIAKIIKYISISGTR